MKTTAITSKAQASGYTLRGLRLARESRHIVAQWMEDLDAPGVNAREWLEQQLKRLDNIERKAFGRISTASGASSGSCAAMSPRTKRMSTSHK